MEFSDFYVDMHCHPAMKPLGKSFRRAKTLGVNAKSRSSRNSIWFYDPPKLRDKLINYLTHLTKFSQASMTSLAYGRVGIVCASLYPLEKWFFQNKIKNEFFKDIGAMVATGIGKKRVDYIQNIEDYFEDLERQYDFYKQLHNHPVHLDDGRYMYRLTHNWSDIINNFSESEDKDIKIINVVFSIEGLHSLNTGLQKPINENELLKNAQKIKDWEFKPFFVTFAHHFWNDLCGHAKSLSGIVSKKADQSMGMDTGFTKLGKKVLNIMLNNEDGRRILIDIKHMSMNARKEYYKILKKEYIDEDIPLIVSHGACNGLMSPEIPIVEIQSTGHKFQHTDINFYDEEIVRVTRSNGIFSLQLDERRIANRATLNEVKHSVKREKILHYRSELVWHQIQHIAELLDHNDLFAWGTAAIGSDFDGIIDPLNGYWTAEEMPYLADYLERHAHNFMEKHAHKFKHDYNRISANDIVSRVMCNNAVSFMERYYTTKVPAPKVVINTTP
jgi:microsomal dipeptidase-like Zn-dependent dipeptidase